MTERKKRGSVYQNQAGRWIASIKDPKTGKRLSRYASTEAEANKHLRILKWRIFWRYLLTTEN